MTEPNSAGGAMLSSQPAEMEVWSGQFVDLRAPDPATIMLEDVARGLGYACRYGGSGIRRFYSVAEHSILVRDLLRHLGASPALATVGLWHDAAEAYLHDVTAPLKWALRSEESIHDTTAVPLPDMAVRVSAYDRLSHRMDSTIAQRFGLPQPEPLEVATLRDADMWALRIAARDLPPSGGERWRWPGSLPEDGRLPADVHWYGGLSPDAARWAWFLAAQSTIQPTEAP